MAKGFTPIKKVEVGGVSLVSAEYANQLIAAINILGGVRISPIANVGEATFGAPGMVLDFAALDGRLKKLEATAGQVTQNANITIPFVVTAVNNTDVSVYPGLMHGLSVTGVSTNIAMSGNSITNIYMNVTIDNNGVATAAAIANTTGSVPAHTTFQAYKWIAAVQGASGNVGNITQYTFFSQEFSACNRNNSDPATTPGDYRFFVD